MSPQPIFSYNVYINGIVNRKSEPEAVRFLTSEFSISEQQAKRIIYSQRTKVKSKTTHAKAYRLQQHLELFDLIVEIEPVKSYEEEALFTLVPENEELTDYETLKQKMSEGQEVICSQCEEKQPIDSHCRECGALLIGRLSAVEEIEEPKDRMRLIGIILMILIVVAIYLLFRFT